MTDNKSILESEVLKVAQSGKIPAALYRNAIDFLKHEGESQVLAEWIMDIHLGEGEILAAFKGDPVVSVVVPCFNYGEFLRECIESVLKQTFTSFEIIIVNDGSTDNTDEVARQILDDFSEHRIRYYSQQNMGIVQPRNRAVTLSKGKYILPIDADDIIAPSFLAKTVPVLESNPKLGYVSTKALFFGDKHSIWPANELVPVNFLITNQQTNTTLYRKAMWKAIGGYDERMVNGFMDWEFWIRATKLGWVGTQLDEPLFFYRRKSASVVTRAKAKEKQIKKQIVSLHPEIYDVSRFKECGDEIYRANWIPPVLIRGEDSDNANNQGQDREETAEFVALKKTFLGYLAQLAPAFKDHFLRSGAGSGEQDKYSELHKQISGRFAKMEQAGRHAEALEVAVVLLALYPLRLEPVLMFMNALVKSDPGAAYTVGTLYLSLWAWEKNILEIMSRILLLQAEDTDEFRKLGLLEGAALLSPSFMPALLENYSSKVHLGMISAADKMRHAAEKRGIKLPQSSSASFKEEAGKHVWYVIDSFGYAGGGVNGVSQAKFAALGSLLQNDDIAQLTVVTPLTAALPAAIADFAAQYNGLRENNDAAWPNWLVTVGREQAGGLGVEDQNYFDGQWLPCSLPQAAPDLIILEGVRRIPYDYYESLGVRFKCPLAYMHHASPDQFSDTFTDSGSLKSMTDSVKNIDFNISVSKNVIGEWKNIPEISAKKWFHIPNCVREDEVADILRFSSPEMRRKLDFPENDFLIVCLASIQHRKGQDLLISQMDRILQEIPEARFLFVGPVLYEWGGKKILELAEKHEHADRIDMLGVKDNALEYVHAADLLVLPSREEALPLSILEAMALGKTCVASDIYGIPELVVDGDTGILFPVEDASEMAKHIIGLAKDRGLLSEMGDKAMKRYQDHFSRKSHARNWRAVLSEILG